MIEDGSFSQLPCGWIPPYDASDFASHWRAAVATAAGRIGQADHHPRTRKSHIPRWVQQSGLYNAVLGKPRFHALLSPLESGFRQAAWEFAPPRWLVNRDAFDTATPVIKLVQVPGWIEWVLDHDPNAHVVHIVRHPGGFLNSWKNRWLAFQDCEAVRFANQRRLETVGQHAPAWAALWGDPSELSVTESELWFWRYAAERIDTAGRERANYTALTFEELAAVPTETSRLIYEQVGLPLDTKIEKSIELLSQGARSIASKWRESCTKFECDLVESILDASFLSTWWGEQVDGVES